MLIKYFLHTSGIKKGRGTALNARWRKRVLRKYRNRCYVTRSKKKLEVHHIHDKSTYPQLQYRVSNGVPLTREMHRRYHAFNGGTAKPCNAKSFDLWLISIGKPHLCLSRRIETDFIIFGLTIAVLVSLLSFFIVAVY